MAWVDITLIDNNYSFTKVRWKANFNSVADMWFSEAPGLVTDGMSWFAGDNAAMGWYGGHRMNSNSYTCGFQCDVTGIDTGLDPDIYRTHCKDASRSGAGFYDQAVVMSGETYYEIDFSLWDGAAGKKLYAPYATMPWSPGDVYVWSADIEVEPTSLIFEASGGQQTFNVVVNPLSYEQNWYSTFTNYSPSGDTGWVTVSPSSGTGSVTGVTVTVQPNLGTVVRSVVFNPFLDAINYAPLTITQRKQSSGGLQNVYLGDDAITEIYLGDTPISGLMLGDDTIF